MASQLHHLPIEPRLTGTWEVDSRKPLLSPFAGGRMLRFSCCAAQEMEQEVEDRRIELDIAQRRRDREPGGPRAAPSPPLGAKTGLKREFRGVVPCGCGCLFLGGTLFWGWFKIV